MGMSETRKRSGRWRSQEGADSGATGAKALRRRYAPRHSALSTRQSQGLDLRSLGYLNYLHSVLSQPLGSWDGFYTPQSSSMNFALRYQLAFGAYAVAALAQQTPAYRTPYAEALGGAIDKMLHVASWGYWRAAEQTPGDAGAASSGHVAVLLSPRSARLPVGPPSDPIVRDNLQYSGHLSSMLGLYEKLTGDNVYDRPFTLQDQESGVAYTYTHSEVAARIHDQMLENRFGGVCCESGIAYVPCNNHALSSNALHDALHGTQWSRSNARWLRSVRSKMVLKGPALRGIFAVCYLKGMGHAAPVAFNFTDAWGLAFLMPFDRPLVQKQYGKFKSRLSSKEPHMAYLSSSSLNERLEISDVAINTGFALIVARGMGDLELASRIENYSTGAFGADWEGAGYFYRGAARTLHTTALYALAAAIEPGGEDFARLFNAPPEPSAMHLPYLSQVSGSQERVGVSRARYSPASKTLDLAFRQVGEPAALRNAPPAEIRATLGNIGSHPQIAVDGTLVSEDECVRDPDGALHILLKVEAQRETSCTIALS
jgi:Linalool dehydratase/isomerase